MKAQVQWTGAERFLAIPESGHAVVMDGDRSGCAATPMEMLLMSVGSCASVDVVSILHKARQQIQDCEVELEGERVNETPARFGRIQLHFVVSGTDIGEKHVERAVRLSVEKYCSVASSLGGVEIGHSYEIRQAGKQSA